MGLRLRYRGSDPIEDVTEARPVIDSNHGQIHAGNAFSAFVRIAALANNGVLNYALVVPQNAYVHFQLAELSGNGAAELDVYKTATLTLGAVVMAPQNRSHISAKASVVEFKAVSAVTNAGTLFDGASLFGGAQKAAVGKTGDENEWVFRPETYLLRVTSKATTGLDGMLKLFWYEESDG